MAKSEAFETELFGYYETRKDANEDAKYLRYKGYRCIIDNYTGRRARKGAGEQPWRLLVVIRPKR